MNPNMPSFQLIFVEPNNWILFSFESFSFQMKWHNPFYSVFKDVYFPRKNYIEWINIYNPVNRFVLCTKLPLVRYLMSASLLNPIITDMLYCTITVQYSLRFAFPLAIQVSSLKRSSFSLRQQLETCDQAKLVALEMKWPDKFFKMSS